MSDHQMGPGWWQASDGKWYPPAGPGFQQPIYTTPVKTPVAHSVTTGCMLGVLILFGILAALMVLGAITKP